MIEIKLESPGRAPRVLRFSSTAITVGRATDCELCLDDPSVSRRHCRISRSQVGWIVEDLGSANGTLLAGAKVSGPREVPAGATIVVGDLALEIVARARPLARRPIRPAVIKPVVSDMSRGTSSMARRRGGAGALTPALAVALAGLGGWGTARAWDRPLIVPAPMTAGCRADDPRVLAADAAADAAAAEVDAESAVRGALRAQLRALADGCAEQSRAGAVLAAVTDRLGDQRLGAHGSAVRALAVAGDRRVVALDEDGGVGLWDRDGRGGPLAGVHAAQAIARSGDGRWLAVGETDGHVRWWDLHDAAAAPQDRAHGDRPVQALAFARDGRLVSVDSDGALKIWRAADAQWTVAARWVGWPGISQLQVAGDRVLAVGDGRAAVWQTGRAKALALTTVHRVTAAALAGDGTQVVVGDAGGVVTRWQLGRRARSETLTTHAAAVRAVAWLDGAVASVGADDALRVAELSRRVRRDGPPLVLVADTPVPVDSLAVADAGRLLVGVGPGGALVSWDLAQRSRRVPATLRPGHTSGAVALAAADGWVATGGADGVVRAWDMTEETGAADGGSPVERACRALGWSEPGCE